MISFYCVQWTVFCIQCSATVLHWRFATQHSSRFTWPNCRSRRRNAQGVVSRAICTFSPLTWLDGSVHTCSSVTVLTISMTNTLINKLNGRTHTILVLPLRKQRSGKSLFCIIISNNFECRKHSSRGVHTLTRGVVLFSCFWSSRAVGGWVRFRCANGIVVWALYAIRPGLITVALAEIDSCGHLIHDATRAIFFNIRADHQVVCLHSRSSKKDGGNRGAEHSFGWKIVELKWWSRWS